MLGYPIMMLAPDSVARWSCFYAQYNVCIVKMREGAKTSTYRSYRMLFTHPTIQNYYFDNRKPVFNVNFTDNQKSCKQAVDGK